MWLLFIFFEKTTFPDVGRVFRPFPDVGAQFRFLIRGEGEKLGGEIFVKTQIALLEKKL